MSWCDDCENKYNVKRTESFALGAGMLEEIERDEGCNYSAIFQKNRFAFAIFGSKKPEKGEMERLFKFLDKQKRPLKIITSSCRGWDWFGRKYANDNDRVYIQTEKANMNKGWKIAVPECNEKIANIADFG